jgi:hypothetical protein
MSSAKSTLGSKGLHEETTAANMAAQLRQRL